ncbi:hypothetical protein [Chamaesiphon sp. OTE_20_metabat_361]|uniref:hypothetical protein n=1 Tax=Chamaesiphon sp. OTE_20_metabat_361 TaxID=2964689 RepID=UPI00286A732F|nr:hypothetical protein [Chamaesiphon sp. OTE_20_metabat_361]
MPKLTALAIALLTVMSIAPKSHAMSTTDSAVSARQPAGDLHAQLIIKIGGNDRSYRDDDRYRQIEREREAELRRREYYSQRRQERKRYYRERYHNDRRYDDRRYDDLRYDDRREYRH